MLDAKPVIGCMATLAGWPYVAYGIMNRVTADDCRIAAPMAEALPVLLVGAAGRVGSMVAHHRAEGAGALPIVTQFRYGPAQPDRLVWDPLNGPGACLVAPSRAGISRVLFASFSAVYDAGRSQPLAKTDACNTVNAFGTAKLEMGLACAPWRERGMDLCMLRLGNVAGADTLLLKLAKSADGRAIEIDIFNEGRGPVRSYIGAKALVSVLLSLCIYPDTLADILKIGTPEPISMDALADAAHHPWTPRVPKGSALQNISLDCNRLASLHPFQQRDSRPEETVRQWKETVWS